MAVSIRQRGLALAAAVVLGGAFCLATSASAQTADKPNRNLRIGSTQNDRGPGGGDFRWRYGTYVSWYYGAPERCVLRRHIYIRHGHRVKRWVEVCGRV